MFKALVLSDDPRSVQPEIKMLETGGLPAEGNVLVRVSYSSLNYKDALAVTGRGKIIRGSYPLVPGIDLVGQVVQTTSTRFREGDQVIGTGGGLGETVWGGYAEMARIPDSWLVPLPSGITPRQAMAAGTAGLTAMLSVLKLQELGVSAEDGPIAVTGATGGVGSFSVYLLSRVGYSVTASTGKSDASDYLSSLGARDVIDRRELGEGAARPMDSARWAGAVDAVGGRTLEALLSQTDRHGVIAACGLAAGANLNTTVLPFILRGVCLAGIDSNTCPVPLRERAWHALAAELPELERILEPKTIRLADVVSQSEELLAGNAMGRTLVRLADPNES